MNLKYTLLMLMAFVIMGISPAISQSKPGHEKIFGKKYCSPYEKPLITISGDIITIECDTAWIINKIRYGLYERARFAILNMDLDSGMIMLDTLNKIDYERRLNHRQLVEKYRALENLCTTQLEENEKKFLLVKADMENAQNMLSEVNKELLLSQESLRRSKKKASRNKLLWGAGGIGLGLIGGILITR